MARTSLGTAPADLQLMCATAAAGPSGVDSSRILPTSSSQLDATNYRVDLDAAGNRFTCVIDSSGSVKSIGPATAGAAPAAPVEAG
ncbi:hypothetical protein HV823_18305 [Rhizobium sp. DBTS2]|uniref:PepSY domain-containing protein n=2 Tax=Mycoplana rhizolycopersici TaxID=2746702 RepID=A0ABX2QJY9_9HYPH|nr:hypothetical protein [Rhizobium rhizolycopersici]